MNTMSFVEEKEHQVIEKPGAQLAFIREKKGYTPEQVASKLYLRTRLIELLEGDAYEQLPQPVFVKGYIRAYAKLLGVSAEPFITSFSQLCGEERKLERTLWQSRREPSMHERLVRWVTGLIVLVVIVGLTFWWQKDKALLGTVSHHEQNVTDATTITKSTGAYLTQVSKIQFLFKSAEETKVLPEKVGD